jgi:hypothetical protein
MSELVGCCLTCGEPYRVVILFPGGQEIEHCRACHRHPECCRCSPEERSLSIEVVDAMAASQADLIPDRLGAHACPPP